MNDDFARCYFEKILKHKVDDFYFVIECEKEIVEYTTFHHPLMLTNAGWLTLGGGGYRKTRIDDDNSLLGCIKRRCREVGLVLALNRVENEWIGFRKDTRTGELEDVHSDVLQLRIRPAG